MALLLTPQMLAAAYEYLRTTPPFKAWKLPHADEIELAVTLHRDREGDHCVYQRTTEHIIRVSAAAIKTTDALMQVMAHEMLHARQEITKTARRGGHNADFKRLAKRVCRYHGWDETKFV